MNVTFLWGPLYRGIEFARDKDNPTTWHFFLGWKTRYGKRVGW